MKKDYAQYLIKKTTEDYNLISQDYARTRAAPAEDIINLTVYLSPGDKVLDLGCGSGRLYGALQGRGVDYTGIDNSLELIAIAKIKYLEANFVVGDVLNLPFPGSSFDKAYSVAVLHHIPSTELRKQFFAEAARILKPGGLLIIRVWDLWRDGENWRRLLKHTFLKLTGKSQLDFKDILIPWKDSAGKAVVMRFLHGFTRNELNELAKYAGFKIKKTWLAGEGNYANIYIVAEK